METQEIQFQPYNIEYKDFTVREVFEALKENGFEHIRGQWTEVDSWGKIIAGCVLGQTGVNLGVLMIADDLVGEIEDWYNTQLNNFKIPDDEEDRWDIIDILDYEANQRIDRESSEVDEHALEGALNKFIVPDDSKWSTGSGRNVGSIIIHWNDKSETVKGVLKYALPTYEDVTQMAYDLLSPHFDETIKLIVKKYDFVKKEAVNA